MISRAAAATTAGVRRFRVPSWSLSPYLPQALPGGPSAFIGRDENGGWGDDGTGFEGLVDDIVS